MEENENGSLLAEVPREGETAEEVFNSVDKELQDTKEETEETPADSLTEKKELPDQAHFLKQNEAWEQMRKDNEALQARLEALEKPDSIEKSEFVSSLVGDNEEIERKWKQERENLKEEVKNELLQSQVDAQRKETETREYWNKWTQERFDEVSKEFKVDFKSEPSMKNELAKIMTDYTPTDEQGNLDYRKGMKLLTDLKKADALKEEQKVQVKKNIADATVSREGSTKTNKGFLTSQDLRGKDWRTMIND